MNRMQSIMNTLHAVLHSVHIMCAGKFTLRDAKSLRWVARADEAKQTTGCYKNCWYSVTRTTSSQTSYRPRRLF